MARDKFTKLVANIKGNKLREERLKGVSYYVAPIVMMVEGVHNGSRGPIYYPADELEKSMPAWNNKPITIEHPPGDRSAGDPDVLESQDVGKVLNARWDGRQKAEAWLEKERVNKVAPELIKKLKAGEKVEVSTGLFMDYAKEGGTHNKSKYDITARNHRPDHVAVLLTGKGACSIEKGAGLLVNSVNSGAVEAAYNRYFSKKERKGMSRKDFGDPKRRAFPVEDQEDLNNAARLIGHAKNPNAVKARLKRIAKAKGLKVPKSWKSEKAPAKNAAAKKETQSSSSFRRTEDRVRKALVKEHKANGGSYYPGFIEDINSTHVIVGKHDYEGGETVYHRRGYKLKKGEGAAELVGMPERVYKHTEYRTDKGDSMVGNSEGSSMPFDRSKAVSTLVGNGNFTADELSGVSDKVLEKLTKDLSTPATNATSGPVLNSSPAQTPAPVNVQDWLSNAPAEVQQTIRPLLIKNAERKKEIIAALKPLNVYNAEYLETRTTEELEGMLNLYRAGRTAGTGQAETPAPVRVSNYAGAFSPPPVDNTQAAQNNGKPTTPTTNKLSMPKLKFERVEKSARKARR